MRPYDSKLIAKYLLALGYDQGKVLNVTKVQKLLFIAYGYFLNKGRKIIDEQPKAWPYGPVFPKTRKIDYGIVYMKSDLNFNEINSDEDLKESLKKIVEKYSIHTAKQLSDWSHMQGSPWEKTTKQPNFDWNAPIPDEFIKDYFSKLEVI